MTNDEFLSRFVFKELTEDVLAECEHFSCGVNDLDEYFQKDVLAYSQRMVTVHMCSVPKNALRRLLVLSPFHTTAYALRICLIVSRKIFVS